MNKNLLSKFFLIIIFIPVSSYADSPLTSTTISDAYQDIGMVVKAADRGKVTGEIARFLTSEDNSIDEKAAVINAVGWDFKGTEHAEQFCIKAFKKSLKDIKIDELDGDALFCIGYLQALDDYLHPEKALPYLEAAKKKNEQSLTVALILALAQAQNIMDSPENCEMWNIVYRVLNDKSLYQDIREGAKKIIKDYMILYKC